MEYCTEKEFLSGECTIKDPVIKKQWLGEFLYATESGSPIYSSFGRNSDGDIYFESSLGNPYSVKKLFTFKSDGREYIDGIRRNVINLDSNLYSTYGIGIIVEIDGHKCYLKLSNYEAVEMYDFDEKKYTSAKLEDILGYKIESNKNSLLITSTKNTFIYAYITTGNYLIMQKFKVVSNDASNCIQLIKTFKEDVKTISKDSRRCMITKKQYVECLDMDENQMYVIRIYDSNLNFLKQYELEKNNAPSDRAFYTYHETVWLKDEISIFMYYTDTSENNAKPIMVLKKLTVTNSNIKLENLNNYLVKDTVFGTMQYKFSDVENSLAIFNEYYFGLSSLTETTNRNLIVALFNIFNDDLTIDTHYFDIPLKDLYDIEYQSGLQAFGYKNAYGVQMNYKQNNEYRSGFIVFGYANTTDPDPINNLFEKYSSYTIKIKDYYKGIENNLFCYVFVNIAVTEVPNVNYITVKNAVGKQIKKGDTLTLNDELTITRRSNTIPKGRYVLGLTPYLNEADYDGFIECSSESEMFGKQVPTDWYPDEYYGRTIEFKFTVDIDCYENCETCTNKGLSIDDQQCDTCKNGYYFVENTNNCFGEPPEGYYFNRNKKVYSKCYDSCKICSTINDGVFHNCLSCKENYLFYRHTNCLDCKHRNKYVNYEQTECIDSVPDGFYVNNTEYNTIDKCYNNCLTCSKGLSNDGNMNCLTCDNVNGYYLVENTNNCEKDPYPGYYLDGIILKKCYQNCLTCSGNFVYNGKGNIINMNCDTCDESKGYYLIPGTKNCEDKNNVNDGKCPEDRPILKDEQCILDYCTKEEYENKKCTISSPIIKKQWIGDFPYITQNNIPIYSTLGQNEDGDIFFESNLGNPLSDRKIYTLKENGRGYIDGIPDNIIDLNSNLYSKEGNGAIVKLNGHKCYLKLSYNESIELYDFDDEKYTSAKLEDILGYKIESHKNSLLRTNEENTFIYAYITTGNYLIMQKFKVVSNDASNCIQLIKTFKEDVKTISKDSRRCMITKKQYVECLDMDENQMYVIRIYDKNLNYLKQYELEKNNAPSDRAFKTYHETVWLKNEISIFIYYNDISDNNAKPIIVLKQLTKNNGEIVLSNLNSYLTKDTIWKNIPYTFSDSENSLAIFNSYYFALSSLTESTSNINRHLIITLFNLFNDDKTIHSHYFDVPIKDLYDIDYYSGLQAFGYKNGYGIQFNHKKDNEYRTGFILFGYGNTTDPEFQANLFEFQESYIIKPYDYIKIENNVFCYVLVHVIISELPNTSTGIKVLKTSNNQELKVGDVLSINEEIKITYIGNKDDIPRGKYIVGFTPYLNEASYDDFYECASDLDMFGEQIPTEWYEDEYYGRTAHFVFTVGDCFQNCKSCLTKGQSLDDQKCQTCLTNYYFVENTQNCFEYPPDGYYFNNEKEVHSKCYDKCKTCSKLNIGNIHNCLSCYPNYLLYNSTNCLDCKYRNKYANYEQIECIDSVPDGFYVNNTEYNTIDKCYKNCLTCSKGLSNDGNMNCLTCDNVNGYYFVENTNNCEKDPYPGHYLDGTILKKCYKNCLTCSGSPITSVKGNIINMNCDTCDESKGYYLIPGTKNCEDKNIIYDENCPEEKPILKDGKCVLDYCTEKEFEDKKCNISNIIIKKQWIGKFPYVSEIDKPLYSTFGQSSNDDIYFESNLGNPFTDRKIYTLEGNGRGYIEGFPGQIINLNSGLFSTYGNGAIVKINGHKCYLRLSYHETIELYDFDNGKYTSAKLEDILGYKIESYKNSLLRTNEENTFIYAYITNGNYLIMQKFKVVSNDASNCIQLIKTSLESFKTISKNSRRCMITENQYIECLDMGENQMYVIRIYDKNLNYLKQYELEKNKAPSNRAYYTYHEAVWLKDEVSIFVYFNDISDNNAKPILILKKLILNNGEIELVNLSSFINKEKLYNSLPYMISDSENSLAIINKYYFALSSITSYENRHLLIILFNIFNDDNTITENYYDIPIKELYDINYYGNLQAFGYKNGYGIQFDHKKGNEYRSGFILFGYGNTTDPKPIDNLFTQLDSFTFKPLDYIKIENNLFCYVLVNIIISELPNSSTGIKVLKTSNNQELKVGDVLSTNEEIKITYTGNKDDIPRGKYIVGFTPYLTEASYDDFYECTTDIEMIGEQIPTEWYEDEYYGRTAHFVFTFGDCFKNCKTCITKGSDINNQKCETCLEKYYFVENTQNCFEYPPEGYYFNENKEVHSKCYDKCKTCSKLNTGNIHNCLSCYPNYLLYNSTNCLDCKYRNKYANYEQIECIDSVPDGFYVNNTEYNTIDKCYKNCKTCSKASDDDYNMYCLTCDNLKGFYLVENTNNCEKDPYPGYYLDDTIWRKCHISCSTCSAKPLFNNNGEVTNCDTCNKDLGFYPIENSNTCGNKTRGGEYFDEDCTCYKKCYKDCLTCSGKEINEYHMNCLNCDISKSFTYFAKTTNCLNCKSLSKYVNYEQTECIDSVPKGYYVNDTEINTINKCYTDCKTCFAGGSNDTMNCLTCQPSLYLKNGNCVKTYTCPYKFFYQIKIDKNADVNQKICLDENEICPCSLPFYYTHTNECVETCPLELLLYQGCKVSNFPYGLNKVISLVKLYFSQGMIDTLSKSFSLSDYSYLYSLAVKLSIYSLYSSYNLFRNLEMTNNYQSLSNDNITSASELNYFGGSDVDLGPCEEKLRKYYNIPEDIKLTIIKLDFKKNDSSVNNIQYEIFNPKNRTERLDLSICNDEKIIVKNPLDTSITPNRITLIEDYGLWSESNDFFNNECSIFTSEEGTDVLIQDRIIEYNYNNKICQNDCEFKEINKTTGEALCLCPPNKGFINTSISNIEEIMNYSDELTSTNNNNNNSITNQKYSAVNTKVLKCTNNILIDFFKNYILIIYTLLLIAYIIISFIFFINKKKYLRNLFEGIEDKQKIDNKSNPPKDIGSKEKMEPYIVPIRLKKTIDKDMFDYSEAVTKDKRTFISILFSSLKKREIILLGFTNDSNINILKKCLLILAFINYFATNTFFFTEKNIHQIYLDKGKYNFAYQCKYIIFASLISSIFLYLAKCMCTVSEVKNKKNNQLPKKILILITISTGIFIFYWVYIGSFTSTYINTKKHLIINVIITFVFCSILEFLLAIISAILRICGIRKKKSTLYSISKIINFL